MITTKHFCGVILAGLMSLGHANPVLLNQASAAQLVQAVKGIGPARADAIVAYRQAHGPFRSLGDLVKVHGISPRFIERNLAMLTSQLKL